MEAATASEDWASAAALVQEGRLERGTAALNRLLALGGFSSAALVRAGDIWLDAGQLTAAAHCYEKAVQFDPTDVRALGKSGDTLCRLGMVAKGSDYLRRALRVQPDDVGLLTQLGIALICQRQPVEAMRHLERAVGKDPKSLDARIHLAAACVFADEVAQAEVVARSAVELAPSSAAARRVHSVALAENLRFAESLAVMAGLRKEAPLEPGYMLDEAGLTFALGKRNHGFEQYHNWVLAADRPVRGLDRDKAPPVLLDISSAAGKRVLVTEEQGYGDAIQFARYIPLLGSRAGGVVVYARPALLPLLQSLGEDIEFAETGGPLPSADFRTSLMSLPFLLRNQTGDEIPGSAGYLAPNADVKQKWRQRLVKQFGSAHLVGVAFGGSPTNENNVKRSIPAARVAEMQHATSAQLVCLQTEMAFEERNLLEHAGVALFGDALRTFDDTAALCACVDRIITVDTSIAHLAGAIGHPRLTVLVAHHPDWRWMMGKGTRYDWYASARVLRQPVAGDWGTPLRQVLEELPKPPPTLGRHFKNLFGR